MRTMDLLECAEFLKVDRTTAMKLAQRGEIVGARVGRAWVFLEEDVVDFLRKLALEQTTARLQGQQDVNAGLEVLPTIARDLTTADKRRPGRRPRPHPCLPDPTNETAARWRAIVVK